ncbi:MAG: hypothetical protein ABI405_11110 [Parafilimonas sp.]
MRLIELLKQCDNDILNIIFEVRGNDIKLTKEYNNNSQEEEVYDVGFLSPSNFYSTLSSSIDENQRRFRKPNT